MLRIVLDCFFEVSFMNFCVIFLKPLSSVMIPRKHVDLYVHAVVGFNGATVKMSKKDGIVMGEVRN